MTHHEERTAPAGRPPQKMVRLAAEPCKHSRTTARPQRQSLIDAAREANPTGVRREVKRERGTGSLQGRPPEVG